MSLDARGTADPMDADLMDADLVARRVHVAAREVVFVKGILEASEGLGALFARRGGDLVIAAPRSRVVELDELLADLEREIGAVIDRPAPG